MVLVVVLRAVQQHATSDQDGETISDCGKNEQVLRRELIEPVVDERAALHAHLKDVREDHEKQCDEEEELKADAQVRLVAEVAIVPRLEDLDFERRAEEASVRLVDIEDHQLPSLDII